MRDPYVSTTALLTATEVAAALAALVALSALGLLTEEEELSLLERPLLVCTELSRTFADDGAALCPLELLLR